MSPEVSIIMPVYNKEDYLQRALESICIQKFKDWELIVVDDGSTDQGKWILEEFKKKDDRIVIYEQENAGVSAARNQGMKLAKGEWLWFVDADDRIFGDFLETIRRQMSDKTLDVIAAGYTKVGPDGRTECVQTEEYGVVSQRRMPRLFMEYQYRNGFWGYIWNKLIRRSMVAVYGLHFKEGLMLAEDLKFMVQIYQHCRSVFLTEKNAVYYTVDARNNSAEKKIDYPAQLEIQKEIYEWIVQKKKEQQYQDFLRKRLGSYLAFCVFYGFLEGKDPRSIFEKIPEREYLLSISDTGIDRVMRPVIRCLKKQKWHCLYAYLYGRKLLQTTVRKIWKRTEKR